MSENTTTAAAPGDLRFGIANAGLAIAAAITIGLGYWLLSQGSIAAAPVLLIIGYVVLAPLAVLL